MSNLKANYLKPSATKGGAVNYSAGLAMLRPSDHSLTELIIRADNGLYQAKALGRGRLELTS